MADENLAARDGGPEAKLPGDPAAEAGDPVEVNIGELAPGMLLHIGAPIRHFDRRSWSLAARRQLPDGAHGVCVPGTA